MAKTQPRNEHPQLSLAAKNKTIAIDGFETLFNRRDFLQAVRYWSPDYIQHSAHVPAGREGLFNLVKSLPTDNRYELQLVVAEGDYVVMHGRFTGSGRPANWVAADILRMKDGLFVEHWDVLQYEASRAESKSGNPMFGKVFPK